MRLRASLTGLVALGLVLVTTTAQAANPMTVEFIGYQQLNGRMLFQIRVDNVAPANQPPLKSTGDRLNFGPYQVGAFHQDTQTGIDPDTGQRINLDVSTLELINLDTGEEIVLPFRRAVRLKAGPEMKATINSVSLRQPRPA